MRAGPAVLLDVNVLVALSWPQHVHHARAHAWFDAHLGRWATTPITESGLVRLSTTPSVVGRGVMMAEALGVLRAIRGVPRHEFWPDDASFGRPRLDLARLASRRQVTDVHLANLAAGRSGVLATLDASVVDALEPADRHVVLLLP